jgi:hypothetical protein
MTLSAAFLAALGLSATFLPQEILKFAAEAPEHFNVLLLQICGALYLGFAMLDWSSKGALLGGIYGRPIVVANFMHFLIGAIAIGKLALAGHGGGALMALAAIYTAFAVSFAYLMFGPGPPKP